MRIANATITRNYVRNLEKNYSLKYQSEQKISSQRQFEQASECPAQAASAMRVRKAIANLNNYQYNLKTANSIYTEAESSMMAISDIIQLTYEKCIEAANGTSADVHTHAQDQLEMIAINVEEYADEIARLMNATVADRRLYGGVNNDYKAFAIETIGNTKTVTFNGVEVDRYSDPAMYPAGVDSYCDIGLGMTLVETGYIDVSSVKDRVDYSFTLTINDGSFSVINFPGDIDAEGTRSSIQAALNDKLGEGKVILNTDGTFSAMQDGKRATVKVTDITAGDNKLTMTNKAVIDEQSALKITFNGVRATGCGKVPTSGFVDLEDIKDGVTYTFELALGNERHTVSFVGGADKNANVKNINDALKGALGTDKIKVYEHGLFVNSLDSRELKVFDKTEGVESLTMENRGSAYSNNIIQSILDAANYIRSGNGEEIARYADHIYSLQTKVSLTLAEIGNATKFIEFNQERITNNMETLMGRQNDLESTDIPTESTTWKMLDMIYSATLQMSAAIIPQSIFDFI